MIEYSPGYWQILFVFSCRGSVFPKAVAWALPSSLLAIFLHEGYVERNIDMSMSQLGSFNFILGFLVVFRSQQAYSRFWEGATIVQQVRGEWFNAVSSCFAFCSIKPEKQEAVHKFQHLLVRLASLLYCTSLQRIAILQDESFEIIDLDGISEDSLKYLAAAPEKCLVILQWIQSLVAQGADQGIIAAPAPIVSRVFQELSRGIVNIVNAQKITDVLFPFPYAQIVSVMLMISSFMTPVVMAIIMEDVVWCGLLTFTTVFTYWSVNYIAAEIEMPFGDDANDLPVAHLQESMNTALLMLMQERCKCPPEFELAEKGEVCTLVRCPFYLITDLEDQQQLVHADHAKAKKFKIAQDNAFRAMQYDKRKTFLNSIAADAEKRISARKIEAAHNAAVKGHNRGSVKHEKPMSKVPAMPPLKDNSTMSAALSSILNAKPTAEHRQALHRSGGAFTSRVPNKHRVLRTSKTTGDIDLPKILSSPEIPFTVDEANVSFPPILDRPILEHSVDVGGQSDTSLTASIASMERHFAKIIGDLRQLKNHPKEPKAGDADPLAVSISQRMEQYFSWIAKEMDSIVLSVGQRVPTDFPKDLSIACTVSDATDDGMPLALGQGDSSPRHGQAFTPTNSTSFGRSFTYPDMLRDSVPELVLDAPPPGRPHDAPGPQRPLVEPMPLTVREMGESSKDFSAVLPGAQSDPEPMQVTEVGKDPAVRPLSPREQCSPSSPARRIS